MKDEKTLFLRHTLATLAYRGAKALRGAPDEFATFRAGPKTRTPAQILAHLGDLLDWGLSLANGKETWQNSPPLDWEAGVERFFRGLEALEARLANGAELGTSPEKLFQGPIADSLTHIGQIAMLRRLAGSPVRGENYLVAKIAAGGVGADQAAAAFEFD
ncbi:MAG TPA: hypothetical protein VH640_24190 [Bryobacteraceae bacterium]|jgi:hypothetical protein